MDKAKRKAIIAGNWKMNKTATEAAQLIDELIPAVKDAGCEVVICTPYTDLVTAVAKTKGTNIHVGAENVHFEKSGAFTGEVSADMLLDLGVEYVVIGHSERRQYFGETDETVNKRTLAALNAGLKPIVCVGESLTQREQGVTEELVRMQVKIALKDVTEEQLWSYAREGDMKIIVSPIGGQGFIFGRGNHQFSARVLRAVGKENITVIAPESKILSIAGYQLHADCGAPEVNESLRGYYNVLCGYGYFLSLCCK